MRTRRGRTATLAPPRPGPHGDDDGGEAEAGIALRCEDLTIGVRVVDGVLALRLVGGLDRRSRDLLLRVVQRGVRSCTGEVALDCALLASCDDCGIDALGVLRQLPGVRSVVVHHPDPTLAERLLDAGLASRLGLTRPGAGASADTAADG